MPAITLHITPTGTRQIVNALRHTAKDAKQPLRRWRLRMLAKLIEQDYRKQAPSAPNPVK